MDENGLEPTGERVAVAGGLKQWVGLRAVD
jgi:hypothetical protein